MTLSITRASLSVATKIWREEAYRPQSASNLWRRTACFRLSLTRHTRFASSSRHKTRPTASLWGWVTELITVQKSSCRPPRGTVTTTINKSWITLSLIAKTTISSWIKRRIWIKIVSCTTDRIKIQIRQLMPSYIMEMVRVTSGMLANRISIMTALRRQLKPKRSNRPPMSTIMGSMWAHRHPSLHKLRSSRIWIRAVKLMHWLNKTWWATTE